MERNDGMNVDGADVTRERAEAIWLRLIAAWRLNVGQFCEEVGELTERELRAVVTDVVHRLLEAAGVLPGDGPIRRGPVGAGLASWTPWLVGLLEAGQRGEAELLVAVDALDIEELRGMVIAIWLDQIGLDVPDDEGTAAAPASGGGR